MGHQPDANSYVHDNKGHISVSVAFLALIFARTVYRLAGVIQALRRDKV